MAGIFLSWSSPDRQRALMLRDRLRGMGLEVWEYGEDLPAGGNIHDEVLKAINNVRMAILCFTDDTADRRWIEREADWCYKTRQDGLHELKHILPVWVGPHPKNRTPSVLAETNIRTFDLEEWTEGALERFMIDVFRQLGQEAPRTVPAALFAMTLAQCRELFQGWGAGGAGPRTSLLSLCALFGMGSPPELWDLLQKRYGDRPEDLMPFDEDKRLLDLAIEVIGQVNRGRTAEGKRPLFLRWMQDELFDMDDSRRRAAREIWRSGDSLLVVDSISTFHAWVADRIQKLPSSLAPSRSALLWLPPYTQQAARLESSLKETIDVVDPIGEAYSDLYKEPDRPATFDAGTSFALRLWLMRALRNVPDDPPPLPDNIDAMGPRRPSLNRMLSPQGGSGR